MKKFLLFLSAFVPLYFLVLVKLVFELIFGNLRFNILNSFALVFLVSAIGFGIIGAKIAIEHDDTERESIKIISKKSITEQYFLGYFSLFVLFALSFNLEKVSMFVVFILVITLIGLVYIKNNLFYINPFLNILGYNFYDITYKTSDGKKHKSKFIFKGELDLKNVFYSAMLSHENFSMIENDNNKFSKKTQKNDEKTLKNQ